MAIAAFEAVALAMLAPLKTVQPITLLVDRQTGYVQALDPLTPRRIGADEALTGSLLAQYVMAREQFDRATVGNDYRKVALWSAGRTRQVYLAQMPATNPESPFQRFPQGTRVDARVKSVSRLSPGVALVRFDTQTQDRNGRADAPQPWLSVVRFRYVDAPMRFEDRLVNPLGFQVVGYQRDAEAPPPPPAVQATATSSPPTGPVSTVTTTTILQTPFSAAPSITVGSRRAPGTPAVPRRTLPSPDGPPRTGAVERREIPLSNLPMGSPFSPAHSTMGVAQSEAPR